MALTLHFTQEFPQSLTRIFEHFARHENLQWSPLLPVRGIREANEGRHPGGVGSVRRIGLPPFDFEETITRFEPNRLIEYRITRGSPLKNHLGRMQFSRHQGQTRLEYTIEFETRLPGIGWLIRALLERDIRRGLQKLAASAK